MFSHDPQPEKRAYSFHITSAEARQVDVTSFGGNTQFISTGRYEYRATDGQQVITFVSDLAFPLWTNINVEIVQPGDTKEPTT